MPLEPEPRSVQAARRWVVDVCARLGRDDLADAAALGVSELVTNALLHAEPPLAVRVGGTREHPRVEVHDGSPTPPTPPDPLATDLDLGAFLGDLAELGDLGDLGSLGDRTDLEARAEAQMGGFDGLDGLIDDPDLVGSALLSTQGRGLGIVSMVSSAWGAYLVPDGKVVWFEPACEEGSGAPSEAAVFTTTDDQAASGASRRGPRFPVFVQGVPVRTFAGFRHHFRELRRELRLLALAHGSEYPLATSLSVLLTDFESELAHAIGTDQLEQALGSGAEQVDLVLEVPLTTPPVITQMLELLELADAFCRAERLLSLARTPLQRDFQRWFLGEFVRQSEGAAPVPWRQVRPVVERPAP
nr:ATP-binding protein [Nocardioides perillae]